MKCFMLSSRNYGVVVMCGVISLFFLGLSQPIHGQLQSMENLDYPFEMQSHSLSNGKEIGYARFGDSGKNLIFIHGLASYAPAWLQQIPNLSAEHTLWLIDLPGFGKTKKESSEISLKQLAADVIEWADHKGLDQFALVGHSMGGQIALHCAHEYADRVTDLILIAPAGFETFSTQEAAWVRSIFKPEVMVQMDEAQIRGSYGLNFHELPSSAEFMIEDRLDIRSASDFPLYTEILSSAVGAMLDEPVFDLLSHITQPALVIFGEEDQLIPNRGLHAVQTEDIAKKGVQALPNASYIMVPDAGHFVQFEQASVVNKEIRDWLRTKE